MRIVTLDETTRENILSDLLKRDPNNYDAYGCFGCMEVCVPHVCLPLEAR